MKECRARHLKRGTLTVGFLFINRECKSGLLQPEAIVGVIMIGMHLLGFQCVPNAAPLYYFFTTARCEACDLVCGWLCFFCVQRGATF